MKILKNNVSFLNRMSVAALSAALLISSCSKDHNSDQNAKLKVINGVFDDPAYTVSVNGTALSTTALDFRTSTAYTPVPAGTAELVVTEQATGKVVSKTPLNLAANASASAYLAPQTSLAAKSVLVIQDDFTPPAANKAKVRFVNLSPDAGNIDLFMNGQPVKSETGIGFKGFSPFVEVDPAAAATFEIRQAGTGTVLSTALNVNIAAGKFTTLWAVGPPVKSQLSNASLALGVISNN